MQVELLSDMLKIRSIKISSYSTIVYITDESGIKDVLSNVSNTPLNMIMRGEGVSEKTCSCGMAPDIDIFSVFFFAKYVFVLL